jgi:hypothetical protein
VRRLHRLQTPGNHFLEVADRKLRQVLQAILAAHEDALLLVHGIEQLRTPADGL